MLYNKLGILLGLAAALIATISSVVGGDSLYEFSSKVVISAVVFYVIGTLIKLYLKNKVFKRADTEAGEDTGKMADQDDDDDE